MNRMDRQSQDIQGSSKVICCSQVLCGLRGKIIFILYPGHCVAERTDGFKWADQETEEFYLGSEYACMPGERYKASEPARSKREAHLSNTIQNYLFAV